MQAEDYDGRTRPAQWMALCFFVRANPFSPTRWHARNFKRRTLAPQHKPLRHLRQVGVWVRQRSKADGHHCGLPKGHLIDLRRQRELYSLQDHGLR